MRTNVMTIAGKASIATNAIEITSNVESRRALRINVAETKTSHGCSGLLMEVRALSMTGKRKMNSFNLGLPAVLCAAWNVFWQTKSVLFGYLIAAMISLVSMTSSAVEIQITGSFDSGGGVVTSSNYKVTGAIGVIGGVSFDEEIAAPSEVLVVDSFSGSAGASPDASKFEWGGQVGQNGSGRLELNTDAANTSWLRSKASAAPGLGQTLVLQMRAQAYAEPRVYGNGQPRGLRVGSDANNVVEFYSIWGNNIGLRVRKNGVESLLAYAFPAGVWSMHDYEISVTPTSAVFKVDGVLAGTFTSNIPTGALNVYVTTYDGGAGNVPVYIDSLSLTLTSSPATLPDSDGDGIPDTWELQYFSGTTNANPNAVCSNGFNTVLDAYIAGLNPTNPLSRFMITNFRSLSEGKAFDWNTVSGRIYSVYWTTNLLNAFQPLETNIPWTRCSFTNSATVPQSFYKVKVELAD